MKMAVIAAAATIATKESRRLRISHRNMNGSGMPRKDANSPSSATSAHWTLRYARFLTGTSTASRMPAEDM
jgi:hypothetical protein